MLCATIKSRAADKLTEIFAFPIIDLTAALDLRLANNLASGLVYRSGHSTDKPMNTTFRIVVDAVDFLFERFLSLVLDLLYRIFIATRSIFQGAFFKLDSRVLPLLIWFAGFVIFDVNSVLIASTNVPNSFQTHVLQNRNKYLLRHLVLIEALQFLNNERIGQLHNCRHGPLRPKGTLVAFRDALPAAVYPAWSKTARGLLVGSKRTEGSHIMRIARELTL